MQSGMPIQPNNVPPSQNLGNGLIPCPYCAEEIKAAAYKCKHCGEWLYKGATLAAPAPNTPVPAQAKKGLSSCTVIVLTALALFGLVLYFGVIGPMMERAAHQQAISPSGPVKHGTGRTRRTIAELEKMVAADPELLRRVRELKAENEEIENSDDIEKHKAFLQKLQQFQRDLENYSSTSAAPSISTDSAQPTPGYIPQAPVVKSDQPFDDTVLGKDAATLWREIRGNERFNMISGIKGSGSLDGEKQNVATGFVAVNKRWHRLSADRKKYVINTLFKRWKSLCQKSGNYALLRFQNKGRDDEVAGCNEEILCWLEEETG